MADQEVKPEHVAAEEREANNERHLDRDPNDPRNVPQAKALPSLNDEGQS